MYSNQLKNKNLANNFYFQIIINPKLIFKVIRYAIVWSTAFWAIHQAFGFLAKTISNPNDRQIYINLTTFFFGTLTFGGYLIINQLTKYFILLNFRFGLFVGGLLAVHILTAELVRWHFIFFTQLLTIQSLPRAYNTYNIHIKELQFWQAPFDWVIVWYFSFSLFYNYLLYAVGLKLFKDLFVIKLRQLELERENLRLEFDFLKAQVNPHFLFNTINNIYSFSILSPEKVADSLLKLADLMRYTLYETSAELVPLHDELTFLNSYLELHRIRHDEHVTIRFIINGEPATQYIPPLLFIIFVENAFKHGIQSSAQQSWVTIQIDISPEALTLQVDNSIPIHKPATKPGIGLQNVSKRLEYLYPKRHKLLIYPQINQFAVTLTIDTHESGLPSSRIR